ncbi:MAG: WYL domain-containing protein, partial [Bacteroidia bacterium]|nr:WYL domain-containing protein [Bacteroidia bacterium]
IYSSKHKGRSYIDFEKNELLKGLEFIDPLHKAIINKKTLEISYQSFKARQPVVMIMYPYLLKEYRNRWFLLCMNKKGQNVTILALDRIDTVKEISEKYVKTDKLDIETFFDDVIGVSKNVGQNPIMIIMKIDWENAPYIITKPIHSSQKVLKEEEDGMIFSINVVWNFELEREILGFGEKLKVIGPKRLVGRLAARLKKNLENYSDK